MPDVPRKIAWKNRRSGNSDERTETRRIHIGRYDGIPLRAFGAGDRFGSMG